MEESQYCQKEKTGEGFAWWSCVEEYKTGDVES